MGLSALHLKDALAICTHALATPSQFLFPCQAEASPLAAPLPQWQCTRTTAPAAAVDDSHHHSPHIPATQTMVLQSRAALAASRDVCPAVAHSAHSLPFFSDEVYGSWSEAKSNCWMHVTAAIYKTR
ncbi:hypothetical protein WJX73_005688 [Symbiochloris irregularis]|uniref:Uncharacterized protein n=1 Tax=Symbiochloris irregularis TaxID=706552 RepID=A0AAW1P0Y1_9CHLO